MSFSQDNESIQQGDNGVPCQEETTTFETLREQFVRPEEQISIFEDNVEEILEMNAAIAMLKSTSCPDPLASVQVTEKEHVQKQHGNDEDLDKRTDAVLAKLVQENDDVLYDSDGNPLEWHDYESESPASPERAEPVKNDMDLPIRLGYFNMNRFLLENGLTANVNGQESEKVKDQKKNALSNLKVDRVVDSISHSLSQGVCYNALEELDSDDDILEVVEVKIPAKKELPQKIARHKEMLRLAQEQAKKRRIDDQNYLAFRIEERKRKKQMRKEAKRAKNEQELQAEGSGNTENVHKDVLETKYIPNDTAKDQLFSEKELNDYLSGNQINSEKDLKKENDDSDESVDDGTGRELPSSQGAFTKLIVRDESSRDGFIEELNSKSQISEEESDDSLENELSPANLQENDDSSKEDSDDFMDSKSDLKIHSLGFSAKKYQGESNQSSAGDDMLSLLSGKFSLETVAQTIGSSKISVLETAKNSAVVDFLSGVFDKSKKVARIGSSFPDDIDGDEPPKKDDPLDRSESDHHENSDDDITRNDESDSEISDQASIDEVESANNEHESLTKSDQPIRMIQDVMMRRDHGIPSVRKQSEPSFKTAFVEEEADVEEDEYMNFGGADGEIDAKLDCYDQEFVGEADKEIVENHDDIIELHRKQMQQKHETDVSKLLHDVTTGNLRKRTQRGSNSKGLDTDSDEENDLLLRKIRKKTAPAFVLDDIDDADMTKLQKLAYDPRSLAFAKCFVREENDDEGCISSDADGSAENRIQERLGLKEREEDLSEENESEDLELVHQKKGKSRSSRITALEEPESDHSIHEKENIHIKSLPSLDSEFYETKLSSERLGVDIFGIIKQRRQKILESTRNKVQEKELHKYAYKRTVESTRISQKQSFAIFAQKEYNNNHRTGTDREVDPKAKLKTFQAFQIGASKPRNDDIRKENKKEKVAHGQSSMKIVSFLTRK